MFEADERTFKIYVKIERRRHSSPPRYIYLAEKVYHVFIDLGFNNNYDNVPSLKEVSASKIVSNISLLHGVHNLPPRLQKLLMNVAIEKHQPFAISLLLETWPDENLCIILPYACRTWKMHENNVLETLYRLCDSTATILQNFIQPKSHLKYLDLSVLPLTDSQISVVCSLATSEISVSSDPDFVIYLNCYVQEQSCLKQLCSVFEAQREGRSRIKLVIKTWHVHPNVCCDELPILFRFLDPHELEEFYFVWCLDYPIMETIFKIMEDFHSLKVLSVRQIDYPHSLKRLLDQLVNVERLDFRGNDIKNSLEFFLSSMYQKNSSCYLSDGPTTSFSSSSKLKFLDLSSCKICDSDILYLARSPHAQTLLTLNLSSIRRPLILSSLLLLLKACKNLKVLQLDYTSFNEKDLTPFFELLPSMVNLRYLNIPFELSKEYMWSVAPLICRMKNLVDLQIRFPMKHRWCHFMYSKNAFIEDYQDLMKSIDPSKKINVYVM